MIRHVKYKESAQNILEVLETDGAVIIDSLISEPIISKITDELRPYLDACPNGTNDFSGTSTKRVGALMARSGPSRPHRVVRNRFSALTALNESSGAHLGPMFGSLSDLKKSPFQGLNFLSNNVLIIV